MLPDNLVLRVDVVVRLVRLRVLLWDEHVGAKPLQRHVLHLRPGGLPKCRVCPELSVRELCPEFVRLPLGNRHVANLKVIRGCHATSLARSASGTQRTHSRTNCSTNSRALRASANARSDDDSDHGG